MVKLPKTWRTASSETASAASISLSFISSSSSEEITCTCDESTPSGPVDRISRPLALSTPTASGGRNRLEIRVRDTSSR